jgi:hypothetical protein
MSPNPMANTTNRARNATVRPGTRVVAAMSDRPTGRKALCVGSLAWAEPAGHNVPYPATSTTMPAHRPPRPDAARRSNFSRLDSHGSSPSGNYVASAGMDKMARVWHLPTKKEHSRLGQHGGAVVSVAFSPDGRHIATGSADDRARIWEFASGRLAATLEGSNDTVRAVPFRLTAPDQQRRAPTGECGSGTSPSASLGRSWRAVKMRCEPDVAMCLVRTAALLT